MSSVHASQDAHQDAIRKKRRAAMLSIFSNASLVLGKLVIALATGSISILSEAIHSASDLLASLIAFYSVRVSDHPPDAEHPYGHGKIEGISGLLEALLILGAALYIIYEGVTKLLGPHRAVPSVDAGLAIMGISAGINFALSRYIKKVAKETDSLALEVDAEHLHTDVLTSIGVFVGLALTRLTHLSWLDPAVGLMVALLIVHTAIRLAQESMRPLLDVRLPVGEEGLIRNILNEDERVLGYHKLRTRKSGSQRHADVHVQIDDDNTLIQAHDLTEELEDRIRNTLPAINIHIHIEPYHAEMRHQKEAHGLEIKDINAKQSSRINNPKEY